MTSAENADLRKRIAELVASGDTSAVVELVSQLAGQRDQLAGERDQLAEQVDRQAKNIAWMTRLLFGRKSEKLSAEELGQLVLAYGASEAEAAKADPELPVPSLEDTEPEEEPRGKPKKRRPNHRGRTKLSEDLERIVTEVVVPDHERACSCCGAQMATFGTVDHERVEYVPAKFVVHVERREKLGCRACKGDAVTADRAREPARPQRVGASVLVYLVESKCDDALPIHRQCDQFARLGFELPPSTAYGYWRYVTSLLEPIADALLGTILEDPVWVGIDEADATLADDTLPQEERQARSTRHLERLMKADLQWRLPRKVFSPELYELYLDLRETQIDASQGECQAGLLACRADTDNIEAELRHQKREYQALDRRFSQQEVAIGEKRSRALALFPLGISQFLNGDNALGGAFLAVEAVAGLAGLTLLAYRNFGDGCDRTAGFQRGSLNCAPRTDTTEEAVVLRRNAEQAMALTFILAVAADIITAQLRFKDFEIVDVKTREQLENNGGEDNRRKLRRRRAANKPRAKVRPAPAAIRAGGGLGLDIRF